MHFYNLNGCYSCAVFLGRIHRGSTKKPDVVEALKGDATVTQLVWHSGSMKLYVGDNTGIIHVCSILTSKVLEVICSCHFYSLFYMIKTRRNDSKR